MAVTRRRRRIRWVVVPVCLVLIAAVIGGLPVYVRPQVDPLRHADAIFVLGGNEFSRYPFGIDLGKQGWAPRWCCQIPGPQGVVDKSLQYAHTRASSCAVCPRIHQESGRRAGTAPSSGAIRVAQRHCRHIHAADFPGPVHPAALLRRRPHHGSEPDPYIVTRWAF